MSRACPEVSAVQAPSVVGEMIHLASCGIRVFPCGLDKRPLTPHGVHDATTDLDQIHRWSAELDFSAFAIACGQLVGTTTQLVVVDLDVKGNRNGVEYFARKLAEHGESWPPNTLAATTPSGGTHIYYTISQPTCQIKNRTSMWEPSSGVDIRANGGYVLAPPSRITAGDYTWVTQPGDVFTSSIAEMPQWLVDELTRRTSPRVQLAAAVCAVPQPSRAYDTPAVVQEGERNTWLTSYAGTLMNMGLGAYPALFEAVLSHANALMPRPLPAEEVSRVAQSALSSFTPRPDGRVTIPHQVWEWRCIVGGVSSLPDESRDVIKTAWLWPLCDAISNMQNPERSEILALLRDANLAPPRTRRRQPQTGGNTRVTIVDGCYHAVGGDTTRQISDFIFEPKVRVRLDDTTVYIANIRKANGRVIEDVRIFADVFSQKEKMTKLVNAYSCVWYGSLHDAQGVYESYFCSVTNTAPVVTEVGCHDTPAGPVLATPRGVYTPDGTTTSDVYFVPRVSNPVSVVDECDEVPSDVVADYFSAVLHSHYPDVVLPLLVWFAAAPQAQRIRRRLANQYPVLLVYGRSESGKTSLIKNVVSPLAGCGLAPVSVGVSPRAQLELQSSSVTIPVVLDEYRADRTDRLDSRIRAAFNGLSEPKYNTRVGATVDFPLVAPLCVIGEAYPKDRATNTRGVAVQFRSGATENQDYTSNYERASELAARVGWDYLLWSLTVDIDSVLRYAELLEHQLYDGSSTDRRAVSARVMATGWTLLCNYLDSHGIDLVELAGDIDVVALLRASVYAETCDDDLDGIDALYMRDPLMAYLDAMGNMFLSDRLLYEKLFAIKQNIIVINISPAAARYDEFYRATNEVPKLASTERKILMRDEFRKDEAVRYVVAVNKPEKLKHGQTARCVVIDVSRLPEGHGLRSLVESSDSLPKAQATGVANILT